MSKAVFGDGQSERPVCHRPVKRKLIGALHEETLFGPVVGRDGKLTGNYTAKKSVLELDPNHLRLPRPETKDEAISRLTIRRQREACVDETAARKWARNVVATRGYKPAVIDPPPGKSGIVRDATLRRRIRQCLSDFTYQKKNKIGEPIGEPKLINPDDFTKNEIKQAVEAHAICQASGVPIRSVVLLRTMTDPVITSRWASDYVTGKPRKLYDAATGAGDPGTARAYVGGNNHHIEIRVATNKKGDETLSGRVVTTFEAAQRKVAKLRAIKAAGIPRPTLLRHLPSTERQNGKRCSATLRKGTPWLIGQTTTRGAANSS